MSKTNNNNGENQIKNFKIELIHYRHRDNTLISLLQSAQDSYGYIPEKAIDYISEMVGISEADIYSIITFYNSFSLVPKGKYVISVCMGTACHVRGAQFVVEELERQLGIRAGETSSDLNFTLETVNCVGACALGPVVSVNGEVYGQMNRDKVSTLLDSIKKDMEVEVK